MRNGKLSWTRDLDVCPGVLGPHRLGEFVSLSPWGMAKGLDLLVKGIVGHRRKERSHLDPALLGQSEGHSPQWFLSPLLSEQAYTPFMDCGVRVLDGDALSVDVNRKMAGVVILDRDECEEVPSNGSCSGGNGGAKAPKGTEGKGEEARQGTQMKVQESGRPGKVLVKSSTPSLCCFWFLCRRRPSCCRLSAGLCVPAGQLDAEDLWPVTFPVNKCLLACLCPVFCSGHQSPLCCPVRALSRSGFL